MAQPSDSEKPPLTEDEIAKAVSLAAKQGMAGLHGYVEKQDLMQICWLDLLEHPKKYNRYTSKGNFSGLVKELVRTSGAYGHKEKAARLGYKTDDLFFYSVNLLREVIPAVLESWSTGESFEHEYRDRAIWMDVETGLKLLSESDYQIICWCFFTDPGEEVGYQNVASRLSIGTEAARQRVNRILGRVRTHIGGENPFDHRRVRSNASAMAELRNQWDGEG